MSQLIRAAARLATSIRRACDGAILSLSMEATAAGAVSREPALNGGAGLYSMPSWMPSAVGWSTRRRGHRQRHVDAGGDAAAGDAIAIDADPLSRRNRPEQAQRVDRAPMRCRAIAFQKAGGAEHRRSRADGRDVFGA